MQGVKTVTYPLLQGTVNPAVTAAATVPFLKAPSGSYGGGVTFVEGFVVTGAGTLAASNQWKVINAGTAGTANSGTIMTLGTAAQVHTAQNPVTGTMVTPALSAGQYAAVVIPVGTVALPGVLSVSYLEGK